MCADKCLNGIPACFKNISRNDKVVTASTDNSGVLALSNNDFSIEKSNFTIEVKGNNYF